MGSATVFQIAPEGDLKSFNVLAFFNERIQIKEGLGGMLMAAVPGVDDRYPGIVRDHFSGALPGMADDADIRVAADYLGGVRDAFPFSQGAGADIRSSDNAAAQAVHSGLKGEPGAGTGFKEKAGHDLAVPEAVLPGNVIRHFIGEGEQG